jgi:hypothetical protein
MTIDIPDGALASGIVAITGVVVWSIRLVANSHVEALKSQSRVAEAIPPMLDRILCLVQDTNVIQKEATQQMARMRRAVRRINVSALICEDCVGWSGETDDCPAGMAMCRCSGPPAGTAGDTGEHQAIRVTVNPPRRSLAPGRSSIPDSGKDRR